jgi:hypothetical protein
VCFSQEGYEGGCSLNLFGEDDPVQRTFNRILKEHPEVVEKWVNDIRESEDIRILTEIKAEMDHHKDRRLRKHHYKLWKERHA